MRGAAPCSAGAERSPVLARAGFSATSKGSSMDGGDPANEAPRERKAWAKFLCRSESTQANSTPLSSLGNAKALMTL
eukprot:scaffold26098_cov32-Tisochrysis_lutea.AAC.3